MIELGILLNLNEVIEIRVCGCEFEIAVMRIIKMLWKNSLDWMWGDDDDNDDDGVMIIWEMIRILDDL